MESLPLEGVAVAENLLMLIPNSMVNLATLLTFSFFLVLGVAK